MEGVAMAGRILLPLAFNCKFHAGIPELTGTAQPELTGRFLLLLADTANGRNVRQTDTSVPQHDAGGWD
jgi:hypothetical protein